MNRLLIISIFLGVSHFIFAQQDSTAPAPMSLSEGGLFESDDFPMFKGCTGLAGEACTQRRMYDFVKKNLRYPTEARQKNIEGSIMLHFTIDEKGKMIDLKALNDIGGKCKEEALRLMKEMKWHGLEWLPGQRQKRVQKTKVWYVVHFERTRIQRPAPAFQMEFGHSTSAETTFSSGDQQIYTKVDKTPLFPHYECETVQKRGNTNAFEANRCANKALKAYLKKSVTYPESAIRKGLEGTVVLAFIVERDGSLTNVRVIQDLGEGCGQAVLDAVVDMQESIRWIPGVIEEETKRVKHFLSYRFRLKDVKRQSNSTSTSTNE